MEDPTDRPSAPAGFAGQEDGRRRILSLSPLREAADGPLLELGRFERMTRRRVLIEQGEPARHFWVLGSGRVRLERMRAGEPFPLGHRGPGETVGETALGGGSTATERATVVDDGEAVFFPVAATRKLIARDASLRHDVTALIAQRQRATEERLASLLLRGVEARLAHFLSEAGRRWGRAHAEGQIIAAAFTHAEIAALIGSTRETVTLLLGKLKRSGVIAFEKRRV